MKAHINGITVEGTPDEVWALLQKSNAQGTNLKPVQPMPDWNGMWHGIFPPYTGQGSSETPDYLKYPTIITFNYSEE